MQYPSTLVLVLTALVALMEAVPAPEPAPVMPVLAVPVMEQPSEGLLMVKMDEDHQVAEASELIRDKRQRGGYYRPAPQYGNYYGGYGGYGQQGHHHHHNGGHYHYHNGHYDWYPNY